MRKTFILLLPFIIGFYGCQSLRNFTDTHAHVFETAIISRDEHSTRNIRVEVGEYLQENLISVQFERVVEYEELEGQEYLYVSGSIKKSLNKDLATVKITARFLDQKGQIASQEYAKITQNKTQLNKGFKGYFAIKTLYDPTIVTCELEITN